MQINSLLDLGWDNAFQSQLDLDSLESQLPFRVVSVQRNLIECIGFDRENQQKQLPLSTYTWRNDPPEKQPQALHPCPGTIASLCGCAQGGNKT